MLSLSKISGIVDRAVWTNSVVASCPELSPDAAVAVVGIWTNWFVPVKMLLPST